MIITLLVLDHDHQKDKEDCCQQCLDIFQDNISTCQRCGDNVAYLALIPFDLIGIGCTGCGVEPELLCEECSWACRACDNGTVEDIGENECHDCVLAEKYGQWL